MERTYEIPKMEIVCMETEDVVRTSTGLTDGGDGVYDNNQSVSTDGKWQ